MIEKLPGNGLAGAVVYQTDLLSEGRSAWVVYGIQSGQSAGLTHFLTVLRGLVLSAAAYLQDKMISTDTTICPTEDQGRASFRTCSLNKRGYMGPGADHAG